MLLMSVLSWRASLAWKPLLVITEPRYLQLVTVSSFCSFTLISVLMPLVSLPSAWSSFHWSPCRRLWRLCQDAQLILPVLLPLLLAIDVISKAEIGDCSAFYADSAFVKASVMILSRNILKKVGESRHPCWTRTAVRNQSPMLLLKRTAFVTLS